MEERDILVLPMKTEKKSNLKYWITLNTTEKNM